MNNIGKFLVHAITLEREAARRFEELAEAMGTGGNAELKAFFARMAGFSRLHLKDAMARGGFRQLPELAAAEFEWPNGTAPEVAGWTGVDALMDAPAALALALDSERRGQAWYAAIAATTQDPEVKRMAAEFAEEEADHVQILQKLIDTTAA